MAMSSALRYRFERVPARDRRVAAGRASSPEASLASGSSAGAGGGGAVVGGWGGAGLQPAITSTMAARGTSTRRARVSTAHASAMAASKSTSMGCSVVLFIDPGRRFPHRTIASRSAAGMGPGSVQSISLVFDVRVVGRLTHPDPWRCSRRLTAGAAGHGALLRWSVVPLSGGDWLSHPIASIITPLMAWRRGVHILL